MYSLNPDFDDSAARRRETRLLGEILAKLHSEIGQEATRDVAPPKNEGGPKAAWFVGSDSILLQFVLPERVDENVQLAIAEDHLSVAVAQFGGEGDADSERREFQFPLPTRAVLKSVRARVEDGVLLVLFDRARESGGERSGPNLQAGRWSWKPQ